MKFLFTPLIKRLMPDGLPAAPSIDRKALVERHTITFTKPDPAEILQVGNGEIAFGLDITGLQSLYGNTFAQWGWHTSPLPAGKTINDFKMFKVTVHGHTVTYPVTSEGQEELYWWLRKNPHRLNLGKLSFMLDGKLVDASSLSHSNQTLDLWRGVITSIYTLSGVPVKVITTCHPTRDALAVQVESSLVTGKRLSVQLAFPYGHAIDITGADWTLPDRHATQLIPSERSALFRRTLDEDSYEVLLSWDSDASIRESAKHIYTLEPAGNTENFSFVCRFALTCGGNPNPTFTRTLSAAAAYWKLFWETGGALDLSGSTDPRWKELERRVVLSQYVLAVNEAGSLPPQESGLVINSDWYGKFHLEMHWWHGAHYQLWGRWKLFDRSLGWYRDVLPVAQGIAKRQGYRGGRWPKMVGPDGRFGPSECGPWLIWQQPHPIFYAEQNYRVDPSKKTLEKWKDVVFETAEFMASFACRNEKTGMYTLGPWVANAAENNLAVKNTTINPAFETAYWRYGLGIACRWRERMGLPPDTTWKQVLENLAPLPVENGVYVMWEGVSDMWTHYNRSHIDVIGPGAFLPNDSVDIEILRRTIDKVLNDWDMKSIWGWDFPWAAMAAVRAGKPQTAVNILLMDTPHNSYSACGINTGGNNGIYFPGNGGLLYAVAMMAAGWDGAPGTHAPGFPDDGSWAVRHERLLKAQ